MEHPKCKTSVNAVEKSWFPTLPVAATCPHAISGERGATNGNLKMSALRKDDL